MSEDNELTLHTMAETRRTLKRQGYDISVSTLRNWCRQYHTHLSPHTNPAAGNERLFLDSDVSVVLEVAAQRAEGLTFPTINKALDDINFADVALPQTPTEALTVRESNVPAIVDAETATAPSEDATEDRERVVRVETETALHSRWLVGLTVAVVLLLIAVTALVVLTLLG